MALDIVSNTRDGVATIDVAGEVDVSCASELRDAIEGELERKEADRVEVDLAKVPYIDSTGIGVLVGAAQRATEVGLSFGVRNPQRNVKRVLDMLGVSGELVSDAASGQA